MAVDLEGSRPITNGSISFEDYERPWLAIEKIILNPRERQKRRRKYDRRIPLSVPGRGGMYR